MGWKTTLTNHTPGEWWNANSQHRSEFPWSSFTSDPGPWKRLFQRGIFYQCHLPTLLLPTAQGPALHWCLPTPGVPFRLPFGPPLSNYKASNYGNLGWRVSASSTERFFPELNSLSSQSFRVTGFLFFVSLADDPGLTKDRPKTGRPLQAPKAGTLRSPPHCTLQLHNPQPQRQLFNTVNPTAQQWHQKETHQKVILLCEKWAIKMAAVKRRPWPTFLPFPKVMRGSEPMDEDPSAGPQTAVGRVAGC